MAWRAVRASAAGFLKPSNRCLQQPEVAGSLQAFAARLLSSASDAHSSNEAGPPGMGTAAGAAASDSQQQHAAPAGSGSVPWNSEPRQHSGANGDGDDRRRRRPRFGRSRWSQDHARGRDGANQGSSRGFSSPFSRTDDTPRAKIKVHYPVRITGFGRLAMRRDVQRLLADCDVHAEDIRLEYDPGTLNPKAFWTDLPTPELQKRAITWNGANMAGRSITVQPVSGVMMQRAILNPLSMGSRGRYVLMLGVQENANLEDIVRFFDGYELMGNPVTVLKMSEQSRLNMRRSQRLVAGTLRAVVRFARMEEAHRALREKQGGYVLNAPVTLRVLQ